MSPIEKISPEQEKEVKKWCGTRTHLALSERERTTNTFELFVVKDEPLVIFHKGWGEASVLACSENHAKELEQKGIVKSPKPQQKK